MLHQTHSTNTIEIELALQALTSELSNLERFGKDRVMFYGKPVLMACQNRINRLISESNADDSLSSSNHEAILQEDMA